MTYVTPLRAAFRAAHIDLVNVRNKTHFQKKAMHSIGWALDKGYGVLRVSDITKDAFSDADRARFGL